MNEVEKTNTTSVQPSFERWSARRADLAAELAYLDTRRAAVAQLLTIVSRTVESVDHQQKKPDGKK